MYTYITFKTFILYTYIYNLFIHTYIVILKSITNAYTHVNNDIFVNSKILYKHFLIKENSWIFYNNESVKIFKHIFVNLLNNS